MERLEILKRLKELEETKNEFVKVLMDIENNYFKELSVVFYVKTDAYNVSYTREEPIKCDKVLMKTYIEQEIILNEEEIQKLILKLNENE